MTICRLAFLFRHLSHHSSVLQELLDVQHAVGEGMNLLTPKEMKAQGEMILAAQWSDHEHVDTRMGDVLEYAKDKTDALDADSKKLVSHRVVPRPCSSCPRGFSRYARVFSFFIPSLFSQTCGFLRVKTLRI